MGALNLDAEEIKKHKLIQEKQEMVEVRSYVLVCMYVMYMRRSYTFCTHHMLIYTHHILDAQRMHMLYTPW